MVVSAICVHIHNSHFEVVPPSPVLPVRGIISSGLNAIPILTYPSIAI